MLEDGRIFTGTEYGAVGETLGEAVFSTGMSGYQETLTDPSYHRQIVVATAPQIGNTGWNHEGRREPRRQDLGGRATRCATRRHGRRTGGPPERSRTNCAANASSVSPGSTPARWCDICGTADR